MSEIHICARCADLGPTCCEGRNRDIFVTRGDIRRIGAFIQETDFFEFRKPANPDYLDDEDPVWWNSVFREDNSRRVIRRNAAGKCRFLTSSGCLLPSHIRPLVCRLFPFQYSAGGIADAPADECPRELLADGESMIETIGMTREDACLWHKTLYEEIVREKAEDAIDHRTHL